MLAASLLRLRYVAAGALLVTVLLWSPVIAPQLTRKDYNATLAATVTEDLYDSKTGGFSGPKSYPSVVKYAATNADSGNVDLTNTVITNGDGGEQIWLSEGKYRFDPATNQLRSGGGAASREGYAYGRVNAEREGYTYWHPRYDIPLRLEYIEDEVVHGLDTYRYQASFEANVTQQYKASGGYSGDNSVVSRGKFDIWIEPQTGNMIRYSSTEEIYYYNPQTNTEIAPWKIVTDELDPSVVNNLAIQTDAFKAKLTIIGVVLPAIFTLAFAVLLAFIVGGVFKKHRQLRIDAVSAGLFVGAGVLDLTVLFGRLTVELSQIVAFFRIAITPLWTTVLLLAITVIAVVMAYARGLRLRLRLIIGLALVVIIAVSVVALIGGYGFIMTQSAAVGFIMLAIALMIALLNSAKRFWVATFSILVWTVAIISISSEVAMSFWISPTSFTRMATPTALIFGLLAIAAYRSCYQNAKTNKSIMPIPVRITVAVVGIAVITTGLLWRAAQDNIGKNGERQFESDTNALVDRMEAGIQKQAFALVGGVGLFNASQEVTRGEWEQYFNSLHPTQSIPGMTCVGYGAALTQSSKAAFERKLKADNQGSMAVYPASNQSQMVVVDYVEPYESCKAAIGFDMYSDPTRRAAMEASRDTGTPVVSGKIYLIIDKQSNPEPGFQMYVPVYRKDARFDTLQHRRESLQGYMLGPVRVNDFVKATLGNTATDIGIEIYDTNSKDTATTDNKIYESNPGTDLQSAKFYRTVVMDVGGRSWLVRLGSLAQYTPGSVVDYSLSVLLGGLTVSVLLGAATYGLYGSRERALRMAKAMSHDLRLERNRAVDLQREDDAILSSMNEGMVLIDTECRIHRANACILNMLGYTEQEFIGRDAHECIVFVDDKGKPTSCDISGKIGTYSKLLQRKDGSIMPTRLSVSLVQVEGHKPSGTVMIVSDMTKQYELDKAKDLFLSLATHQLKTPITAIKWYAEMLLGADGSNEVLPPTKRRISQSITKSVKHMMYIVDNLLNVSRMETGRLKVNPSPVNVPSVVHQVIEDQKTAIETKNQKVTCKHDNLSDQVMADGQMLAQIFANLLNNASKYSPVGGEIQITIRGTSHDVMVSFADRGLGIPKHQQHQVFQKFFRGDNAIRRESSGNGLGLYLVKTLVKANKGEISFVSQEDKGTTFTVSFPRYKAKSNN